MIPLEILLAPTRDDAPCGDDPWATGVLSELETLVLGKPETQFSAAEEPDWKALKARVLEVSKTTKDLRVATIFAATLLRTDGVKGLRAGVQLIRGYVENFWPTLFPLLDASENNDPAERVNALANLAAPVGTDGDVLRVLPALRKTPVVLAPRAGKFGLEHLLAVKGTVPWPEGAGEAPTAALLEAGQKDAGPEAIAAVVEDTKAVIEDLSAIEGFFKKESGPTNFPQLAPLKKELQQIVDWLGGSAGAAAPAESAAAASGGGSGASTAAASGPSFTGAVRSREDVTRALESIIAYYKVAEPSSPVPFLLMRVKKIVPMNFLELMQELTPEAREKILALIGSVEEATPNT